MLSAAEIQTLERGPTDPVWWVREVLGLDVWERQAHVLESVRDHRVTAVRSCHAIGKSTVAAAAVLWFVSNHPQSIVLTTATSHRQVRGILWRELRRLHRDASYQHGIGGRSTETQIRFAEDWWAWGFTAQEYDANKFQGFHAPHVLVVIDEAAGVHPAVFEGIDSAMSGGHSRMLMIGNPTDGSGDFGQAFKAKSTSKIIVDAFDTPNFTKYKVTLDDIRSGAWEKKAPTDPAQLPFPMLISPQWVREKWEKWASGRISGEDDPRWVSRIRAQFPSGGDDSLIPLTWVEQAHERWDERNETKAWSTKCHLGVDVARFGDDTTIRADFREDAGIKELLRAPKQDTMATAGTVVADIRRLRDEGVTVAAALVDADGLGAGVYDRLIEWFGGNSQARKLIREVRSAVRAVEPDRFENRRSEMFWILREMLDPTGDAPIALPPDDDLTQELTLMKWKTTSRGKIRVEGKDDIKERLGRSPDAADAVAYAVSDVTGTGPGGIDPRLLAVGAGSQMSELLAGGLSPVRLIDPTE